MKEKICPLMVRDNGEKATAMMCQQDKCAWWVYPYSSEGISMGGMCAVEMIAMKNADGQYRV